MFYEMIERSTALAGTQKAFSRMSLLAAIMSIAVSGCATTATETGDQDPFEGFNRNMYGFNEAADKTVIGPVAKGYETITPGFFRQGVSNFLENLGAPAVLANDVLQLKPVRAFETTGRFIINSTIGIGGIWDAASQIGMGEGHHEDFGQTLGYWGVPEGPYVVLPLLGPSTLRDTPAMFVDTLFDPFTHLEMGGSPDITTTIQFGSAGLGAINARTEFDDQIELLRSQPEPYTALRRAYLGARRAEIRDGQEVDDPFDGLPDLDDYELYDLQTNQDGSP